MLKPDSLTSYLISPLRVAPRSRRTREVAVFAGVAVLFQQVSLRFVISKPALEPHKKCKASAMHPPCTRPATRIPQSRLKKSQRLRAITYQQVLGLLVVIEDHLVGLAAET